MPFLHAHRRRVPAQDVNRSVVVGMNTQAAMTTVEHRLAFTASTVYGSAVRANLRGICGIDLVKAAPTFIELVGKDGFEGEPALVEYAPVQSGLLPHHPSGLGNCAASGSGHIPDLQIFQNDHPEAFADVERRPVLPIKPYPGTAGGEARRPTQGRQTPLRPLLSSRNHTLSGSKPNTELLQRGGNGQTLAVRQRQRVRHPAIDANRRIAVRRLSMLDLASKADVPAESIKRDSHVPNLSSHRASVSELYPANLRKPNSGPFPVQFTDANLAPLEPECVVDALHSGRRVAGDALEEVSVRFVEVTKRLLLAGLRHGRDPIVLSSKRGQLAGLADVVQPLARVPLELAIPSSALLKTEIVDQPANTSELPEQGFLLGIGVQLVAESAVDHRVDSTELRQSGEGFSICSNRISNDKEPRP